MMSSYNICDELLEEIFKRLPSKTLLLCRSVSKSWCFLISSPDFIRKQTNFQSARNCQSILIQHQTSYEGNFYTVHYQSSLNSQYGNYITKPMKSPKGNIVGSCNGIICLRDGLNGSVSLWNPSIRRKLDLPIHGYFGNYRTFVGFGFDSNTHDYKIVRIFYDGRQLNNSWVYSLKKRFWFEITPPSTRITRVKSPACFVNGVLHWVVETYSFNAFILRFDLSTHVFSEIKLPEQPNGNIICPIIFNGSIGMAFFKDCYTQIWVMKENNNNRSWDMVLTLENLQFKGGIKAVLQLKNGNILISNDKNVYEVGYPKGVCYEVCVRDSPTVKIVDMVMYVESLALLDIGTACINANQSYSTKQKRRKKNSVSGFDRCN